MGTAYPSTPGVREIGSTTMRYIPELYSGKLLVKFYAATVFGAIANTDYEGEIRQQGDTVYIRSVPTIIVRDHKKGQTLVHQTPESTSVSLLVDKGKYWAFATDDVDDGQTDIKNYHDVWTTDASEQLKIKIDTDILANVFADAHASNQGLTAGVESASINLGVSGTPLQLSKTNILDVLVDCGTVLDEQNVPESGRYIVMAPIFCGMVKKSDLKDASLAGDGTSILRNGRLGMIDRFTIYSSNLLTKTSDGGETVFNMVFGQMTALTFASQLVKNENLINPTGFGTLFRGLQVYGYKVIKPEAFGWLYAYK